MANSKPTAPPAATQAHDRFVWLLLALVGQPLTLTLKSGVLVRGILSGATPSASPSSSSSSSTAGDDGLSLSLRQVIYLDSKTRQPKSGADGQVKQALLVNAKDLLEVEAEGVEVDPLVAVKEQQQAAKEKERKEGDSFRTDTDISADRLARLHPSGGRQLQAWGSSLEGDDSLEGPSSSSAFGGLESSTNGRGGGGGGWDQFAANEQRFGLKTDYEDEIYTTRLDRSGKDFKMREARAAQLEREIMKGTSSLTNNAHMAEERGEQLPDVGNEEDRYGAVIRSEGAYVPPGARKAALARLGQGQNGEAAAAGGSPAPSSATAGSTTAGAPTPSAATPSTASPAAPSSQPTISAPSAASGAQGGGTVDQKFRDFVTDERKRLEAKKAQLQQQAMKKEQDSKLASLLQWSQTFKNPYPLPDDLATILGKKPSNGTPGATSKTLSATSSSTAAAGSASAATSPSGGATRTIPLAPSPSPTPSALAPKKPLSSRPLIAEIPPFNPARAKAKQAELAAAAQKTTVASPAPSAAPAAAPVQAPSPSVSPAAGLQPKAPTSKLSATAGAFVFKPNPNAASFTPGGAGPGAAPSPSFTPAASKKPSTPVVPPVAATSTSTSSAAPPSSAPAPSAPSGPVNPFFGPKGAHKRGSSSSALQVKEDFTPFRHKTLPQPADVVPGWPFSGKPYRAIYPPHVFGAGGPPPQQGGGGGPQFQPQQQPGQQQQLPPHIAQAQAAAFAAMQQQQQQQGGGPHPPGSSASSTTGAPPVGVGATAPTLGPNGLPLPPPPPPPHALSPAPPLPPSGAPTPVPLPGPGPGPGQFQPRAAGGGGGFGMPPQMMQHGPGGGSMPPHFHPHHQQHPHPHQQHAHHPNQQHFNHQHQQMQQQFANMHLAQQQQQQQGPPGGPNGLPAGVQFVPGMGLVAMQQQQQGGAGNVGGPPPVQFAPPQQGGGFNPAGGQGPMFTSPSLPHPGHPGHPGHPHQQHPHAPPPPPHLAHHSQPPPHGSHHASPAGHHRNFQGQGGGGPGQPPWLNPQQQGQQQQGGGPGTPTMAAPNPPPPSAPSAPSAPPAAAPSSSTPAPPIPTAPAAAQQAGAAQGMPPQFVQQQQPPAAGGA